MTDLRTELATLIASRICHDLISPVGAISNGLELMALGGAMNGGPELDLITESCAHANARIRFFRVAYGAASDSVMVSAPEVRSILDALTKGSRLTAIWDAKGDVSRTNVQFAFLGLQCLETALRRGGEVTISPRSNGLKLSARAEHISCDPALWHHLEGNVAPSSVLGSASGVAPSQVQFILLPLLSADQGRKLRVSKSEREVTISL